MGKTLWKNLQHQLQTSYNTPIYAVCVGVCATGRQHGAQARFFDIMFSTSTYV